MANDKTYRVVFEGLAGNESFTSASADELRVLLVVAASRGVRLPVTELASLAATSVPRARAALSLFLEAGLIEEEDNIVLEFLEYKDEKKKKRLGTAEIADEVRDHDLHDMIMEVENLLGKSLVSYEVGNIACLYTERGLSKEYILALTAFLKETVKSELTVTRIMTDADKLIEKDITTLEELERYMVDKLSEIKGERELRRLFRIYSRPLSDNEKIWFDKWLNEFGYSIPIIKEALNQSIDNTGDYVASYINEVLTAWHNAGCKTVEDCKAQAKIHSDEYKAKRRPKSKREEEPFTSKYSDFDIDDVIARAIERGNRED